MAALVVRAAEARGTRARAGHETAKLLLLDEPVAGMNREETEDMARFILEVRREWGVTVLMVEHDMGMVMDLSDHVVVLNFGQVIASGLPADVQGTTRRSMQVLTSAPVMWKCCANAFGVLAAAGACQTRGGYLGGSGLNMDLVAAVRDHPGRHRHRWACMR